MNFKFLDKNLYHQQSLVFGLQGRLDTNNVEFCFQFGDNEPIAFATGPNECTITLSPTHGGNMTFNDNGNVFKLFARERNNETV